MEHDWVLYIAALSTAFAITTVMTPVARKISLKVGAIDYPKARGMHSEPMPRMGGIAIVTGFMLTLLLLYRFMEYNKPTQMAGYIIGAGLIVVLGIADDCFNLKARFKLIVQLIAAVIVVAAGVRINVVLWPVTAVLQKFSGPITVLWIIGVTNAVNLVDGLDGLAAGVSAIAALCIMILCLITGDELAVVLTATLAGSCLGFLPKNFSPAQIFMGDTGSTFLGFTLAVTSIMGVFKGYAVLALVVSMLSLGFPIFDTLFAIVRRTANGTSIMTPDRGHLHHRLIDRGLSQRQAVGILYGISAFCGILAIIIAMKDAKTIVVILLTVFVLSFVVYFFNSKSKQNHNK